MDVMGPFSLYDPVSIVASKGSESERVTGSQSWGRSEAGILERQKNESLTMSLEWVAMIN